MINSHLSKEEELQGFKSLLPEKNPDDLQECLQLFEDIKYKNYGLPMFFLDYNYARKCWSVAFRNPGNFINPDIGEKTPLEALHKMLDFLREL